MRTASRLLLAAVAILLLLPAAAGAQETGWVIESFDVRVVVDEDGSLAVTEDIAVDFGGLEKHGIFRDIPVRYEVPSEPWYDLPDDADPSDLYRVLEIDDIRVTSPDAPADVELTRPGPGPDPATMLRIRIGDPDETVSGRNRYTIRYQVRGAMDAAAGVPELSWDVTGNDWGVPILQARATIEGAGNITDTVCFRGGFGSSAPCSDEQRPDGATFTAADLPPHSGMTAAVRFAPGSVEVPAPILEEQWTLASAFVGSGWALPLTVLTALLGFGAVGWLAFRQGRDRIASGPVSVDGRLREPPGDQRRRALFDAPTIPVRFRPPDGLRPAQLGVLVDETVDPVDISATVVDLAVRGYLEIEEVENKTLWFSRTDWRLRRLPAPESETDELDAHERLVLEGLFEDGDEVLLSALKGEFASTYSMVQTELYTDVKRRGWFSSRPDKTRSIWLVVGVSALALTAGLLVAAVLFTQVAMAVVPLVLAALALTVGHRWMPHRTAAGSRLLTETLGFRRFVTTAEADRMDFAEKERIFLDYLPYAVVFGATEHWAKVFSELGVDLSAATSGFYHGPSGFHAAAFSSSMSDFSATVGSSLSTVPSSAGSGSSFGGGGGGFSGGGFGGGGGGSW